MSGYSDPYSDERPHHVLSQETIDRALAQGNRPQGEPNRPPAQHGASSYEPDRPGISRKETTSRRDPLTGDMIEEYSGNDPQGPSMRAHYNWDEPGKAPNTSGGQYSSAPSHQQQQQGPRPGEVRRTNTTVTYDSSGNRVEEHDGEGSLEVRALYNEDDDPSNTYRPPPGPRHQSDQGHYRH